MKDEVYHRNREEVFKQCGLKTSNKTLNCHHIVERFDKKRKLVPDNFPINDRRNLIPLKITVHDKLHEIIEQEPYFRNNMSTRVYLANMAYCGDLCDVPDRLYFTDPIKTRTV